MYTRVYFLFLVLFSSFNVSSQDNAITSKTRLTFERPSMSEIYVMGGLSQDSRIYEGFQKIEGLADNRADHNDLGFPSISGSLEYGDENYQKSISSQLQTYFNKVVAYYWGRDANGNFNDNLIRERGNFTATDGQIKADQASELSRVGDLGYSLIDKSYIFVYDIISLKTYEEIYNEKDAKEKKRVDNYNKNLKSGQAAKQFTPARRVKQGWEIQYAVSIYKLKWTEDIQSDFFNNFWVDNNTKEGKSQKIAAFNAKNFEYTYVTSWKSTTSETKAKTHEKAVSEEVMNNLLLSSGGTIQMLAVSGIGESVEDFKLRANVFSAYPIRVKLGTKESLEKEDRYFLYELIENEQGDKEKKRIGWAYVTKVADNNMQANGEMPTSKFKQHGGKKVYSGVLIEENNDFGLVVNLGFSMGNQFYQGFNLGLEFNTSKIFPIVPGLYIGANLSAGSGRNLNLGDITTSQFFTDSLGPNNMYSTNHISYLDSTSNTSQFGLSAYIGKEFYFLPSGNISVFPMLGFGINTLSINKRNGEDISATGATDDPYSFSSLNAYVAVAVGYNVLPWMNLYVQPVLYRSRAMHNNFDIVTQNSTDSKVNKSFRDFAKSPMLFTFGVRFKL